MNVQEEMDRIFKMQKDNLANERKFKEICKLEITIDRLKGIALDIKLDVVKDLDISDERFNGICEEMEWFSAEEERDQMFSGDEDE